MPVLRFWRGDNGDNEDDGDEVDDDDEDNEDDEYGEGDDDTYAMSGFDMHWKGSLMR